MTDVDSLFPSDALATVRNVLQRHADEPGGLLPILHDVQDALGYIPSDAVPVIAKGLNLSRAEVHGVIKYYHHFRSEPAGRTVVQVCRAESCQACGADALMAHAERVLGCASHHTRADGVYTLEPVYCLGMCALSPAIMVGDRALCASDTGEVRSCRRLARSAGMSAAKIYVPRDSAALAVGADEVAEALQAECDRRGLTPKVVRNSSRGLFWLEPLVEVDTPQGRVAYGPVAPDDVPALLDALLGGGAHPLCQGRTEAIPYLARQERLTFARMGITDPLSLADYEAHEGWAGLKRALTLDEAAIVQEVTHSGLRGRGGAAFPAGIKWQTVLKTDAVQKYVVCNADEGDSGTFSDRMTMEGDPYMLIEGMAIAGLAVGATQGYVYVRSEYPHSVAAMNEAVARAMAAGYLGRSVCGSGRAFYLHVRKGAGSYVCGEETAMLESLEGKRGIVRAKPPLPAIAGLFGQPSVINNVITFASVPADSGARLSVLSRLRHGPLHRHLAVPTRRQYQVRRTGRESVWHHVARAALRLRRRHPVRAGPSRRCRWAARWGRTYPNRNGTSRSTTRLTRRWARWWVTAASSCTMTRPTWRSWRATRWSSAPSNRVASARRAASVRPVAWR